MAKVSWPYLEANILLELIVSTLTFGLYVNPKEGTNPQLAVDPAGLGLTWPTPACAA